MNFVNDCSYSVSVNNYKSGIAIFFTDNKIVGNNNWSGVGFYAKRYYRGQWFWYRLMKIKTVWSHCQSCKCKYN